MSDAISTIGSAAVTTVGTLAVTGAALKAVGKATGNMNRSGGSRSKKSSYRVFSGSKKSKKSLIY